jgi:hypothetical protein
MDMKSLIMLAAAFAATTPLLAADAAGKDDVTAAAKKLDAAANYSWTTTMESSRFTPGPSHGKTEKGGYTYLDFSMMDNTIEAVLKGTNGAIKTEEGWQSLADAAKGGGDGGFNPARFMAMRVQSTKAPAAEAPDIAAKAKDLTKTNDMYVGDLTEDGVKSLMMFGRGGGPGGFQPPPITGAKGSVKFWVKDGVLTKYEYKVQAAMKNQDGDDMDMDSATTVEIKDVGATKVTVPDEEKAKIGG